MEVASVEGALTLESVFAEAAEATGWHLLRFDYGESLRIGGMIHDSSQEQEQAAEAGTGAGAGTGTGTGKHKIIGHLSFAISQLSFCKHDSQFEVARLPNLR